MKQKKIESIVKLVPDILKEMSTYLDKSAKEGLKAISSNTGAVALIVKIFSQPLIDNYFSKVERDKLKNLGLKTYLEASLSQACKSLENTLHLDEQYSTDALITGFEKTIKLNLTQIESTDYTLFFQPKYHPIVVEVSSIVENFLREIKIDNADIEKFKKNFFEEIEVQIEKTFGEQSYKKHLEDIRNFILRENETKILNDNIKLSKIGFKENENLKYEMTYAEWKQVSSLWKGTNDIYYKTDEIKEIEKNEKQLKVIENLIEQYFDSQTENHLDRILFAIADFGKGKSVFLRQYTSKLSKDYLATSSGNFPIYFNLRNFKDYSEEHYLGVIGYYLEQKYNIVINDEYFRNKRFTFLIDSLDECGELSSVNINRVIDSIKKIQNINPVNNNKNRIIITSRPFDEGLKDHLQRHNPFVQLNEQGRPVEYFISIYGFKVEQFNRWLSESIRSVPHLNHIQAEGLNREILEGIKGRNNFDIYRKFLEREILSPSELRRPLFSYMILQLISNSISFDKAGKIGVYLSFLNLLTKEAKYLHDVEYKINLKEQFEARNILHATGAVWLYNRNSTNKSELKKADVCRTIQEDNIDLSDDVVLRKFKEAGGTEIEFLSHSYFGESNKMLHFHHQSFAEILVAEYYLKIIIKYALDKEFDYEKARTKLSLGEPTGQVIDFFKELIILLRDSVHENSNVKEIRKLLFPLLASSATIKNNKSLYCGHLSYKWFDDIDFEENSSEIPNSAIDNWPLTTQSIGKIIDLCRKVVESDQNLQNQSGEYRSSLFDNEVFVVKKLFPGSNIDKWLAIITGNLLYNRENDGVWFNSTIEETGKIFDLINSSSMEKSFHSWSREFLKGIDMSRNRNPVDLQSLDLSAVGFSYSKLRGIYFNHCRLYGAKFINCEIESCDFGMAHISYAVFTGASISHYSKFALSHIAQGLFFPYELAYKARALASKKEEKRASIERDSVDLMMPGIYVNHGDSRAIISERHVIEEDFAYHFGHLIHYGFKAKIWTEEEILDSFVFPNERIKESFKINLFKVLYGGHQLF